MTTTVLPKAYCSDAQVSLRIDEGNLIKVHSVLRPVRNTAAKKAVATKLCTKDGQAVEQVYRDETGKVWEKDQLGRAKVTTDGGLELVEVAKYQKAKASDIPKNTFQVSAFPIAEVDAHFFPSDNQAYVMDPVLRDKKKQPIDDPENMKWFEFIYTIVTKNPGIALVGRGNLQNHEGVFRIGTYQGNLTLQKQLHPEELNQFELPIPEVSAETERLAVELSNKLTRQFDKTEFNDRITERLSKIEPGVDSPADDTERKIEPVVSLEDSLSSILSNVGG